MIAVDWVLPHDCGVARKLPLVPIHGCRSLQRNHSHADMGTDTLFAASRRYGDRHVVCGVRGAPTLACA